MSSKTYLYTLGFILTLFYIAFNIRLDLRYNFHFLSGADRLSIHVWLKPMCEAALICAFWTPIIATIKPIYKTFMLPICALIYTTLYLYFNYFGFYPHLENIALIKNTGEISNQIINQLITPSTIAIIIIAILNIYFGLKIQKFKSYKSYAFTIPYIIWNTHTINRIDSSTYYFDRTWTASNTSIEYIYFRNIIDIIFPKLPQKIAYKKPINTDSNPKSNIKPPTHIIILQIESLDQNFIENTPDSYFSKLRNNSLYFSKFYAQHSGGGSSDAELTTLTGLLPLESKVGINSLTDSAYFKSLPSVLHRNGYELNFYHANKGSFYDRYTAYKKFGFNTHFEDEYEKTAKGWYSKDSAFFAQTLAKIKTNKNSKTLSYIVTIQSHGPFLNHKNNPQFPINPQFLGKVAYDYLNVMQETSNATEQLVKAIQNDKELSNSLIIIYGDHESRAFDQFENENVPLYILHPQIKHQTINIPLSNIDLAPMILNFCSIQDHSNLLGSIPTNPNRIVYFNNNKGMDKSGKLLRFSASDTINNYAKSYSLQFFK